MTHARNHDTPPPSEEEQKPISPEQAFYLVKAGKYICDTLRRAARDEQGSDRAFLWRAPADFHRELAPEAPYGIKDADYVEIQYGDKDTRQGTEYFGPIKDFRSKFYPQDEDYTQIHIFFPADTVEHPALEVGFTSNASSPATSTEDSSVGSFWTHDKGIRIPFEGTARVREVSGPEGVKWRDATAEEGMNLLEDLATLTHNLDQHLAGGGKVLRAPDSH